MARPPETLDRVEALPGTITALLIARSASRPRHEALVVDGERIDYATLDARSARFAEVLIGQGVVKGHRIGLLAPNSVEWAVIACAVMRIGATLVPLSSFLRPNELAPQLAVAGVRRLIAARGVSNRDLAGELSTLDRRALPSLRDIWWLDDLPRERAADAGAVRAALEDRVKPADEMAVIFTSGSRGAPKGVIHTHGGAIRATAAGLAARCIDRDSRVYVPMPFFWVGGFGSGLVSTLIAGATLVSEARPEPGRTLRLIADERVTLFRGWPYQAERLAAHPDFAGTDLSALGPGSLPAVLKDPPAPGSRAGLFGMTETFGPYCGYPLDRDLPAEHRGSCGRPFAGMDVRIVDPATGLSCPTGRIGAIQVGGPNILKGIAGRERESVFTPDGWYDTGDLGRLDAGGFLHFAGRADDMMKIRGVSVYPSEVEARLREAAGVGQAIVVDYEENGERGIGAVLVPDRRGGFDLAAVKAHADASLSAFKRPGRWFVLADESEIPRTATDKVDKAGVQSLLTR